MKIFPTASVRSGVNSDAPARHRTSFGTWLPIFAATCTLCGVPATVQAKEKSTVTVYAGVLAPNKGLDARTYAGTFVDYYLVEDVAIHADVVGVNREESAAYGAVGVSWQMTNHVRPKIMLGTSSNNLAILPDQYAAFTVALKPGSNSGWIVTPGVTYRHYRNGNRETLGTLGVAKYFNLRGDKHGYYVVQASVTTSLAGNGRGRSSATIGLQTVRANRVSFGLSAEAGALIRDPIVGGTGGGRYFAIRPTLSVPATRNLDVFLRGEYADTELYQAAGGTTGLKVAF